jgi:hypothetical protein
VEATTRRFVLLAVALAVGAVIASSASSGAPKLGFTPPQYVDTTLAGGEPIVIADPAKGTLVYTSHEGTTHLYRNGIISSPFGDFQFVANYCNQVNIWTSTDGGVTWQRDHYLNPLDPCAGLPTQDEGFSDPDLTVDATGRMYNTGIDLANDSVFSSGDGGKSWDKGTAFCHDGDRPWLAGGRANEVYMATNTEEGSPSHQIFVSTDGGNTCSSTGIPDEGTLDGVSYVGNGKMYFDSARNRIAEPEFFDNGLGVGTWTRGDTSFTPHLAVKTTLYSHWAAIALDSADTIYMVWDTDNGPTKANQIELVSSKDFGKTWSVPYVVAAPNARVFWPWIAAGDPGKVSIVWYQTNPGEIGNIDQDPAHVSIYTATLTNAAGSNPSKVGPIDAAGRPIHVGSVCQGGTTCVATGQDRRLGDFFTNALDARGCVLIASGDTRLTDPLTGADYPTARPIFMRQNAGPSLIGKTACS